MNTQNYPAYPDLTMSVYEHYEYGYMGITLLTTVRKKHRGKWYRTLVITKSVVRREKLEEAKINTVQEFIREAYIAQNIRRVLPKLKTPQGLKVFVLDHDQRSDEERLAYDRA